MNSTIPLLCSVVRGSGPISQDHMVIINYLIINFTRRKLGKWPSYLAKFDLKLWSRVQPVTLIECHNVEFSHFCAAGYLTVRQIL